MKSHAADPVSETPAGKSKRQPRGTGVPVRNRGIVGQCLKKNTGTKLPLRFSPAHLIRHLKEGLAFEELEDLRVGLDLPMDKLVPFLGIAKATLHRRKISGRLDQAESDRVVRYARLLGRAIEVLESLEDARRWLNSPQIGLGQAIPLEYAETEVGAREVEDLLGRIEYGVYS